MSATYSQIKTGLAEISVGIVGSRNQLKTAKKLISDANDTLAGMVSRYGQLVADIDTLATSEPGDAATQFTKAEKDKLVAEFIALQSTAAAMVSALSSIEV